MCTQIRLSNNNVVSLERWTGVLLFGLFTAIFVVRGPVRAISNNGLNDLLSPYVQAAAWAHGADPYSPRSLLEFWPKGLQNAMPGAQEIQDGSVLMRHGIPTAYPLTSFLLLAPFTQLPFSVCRALFVLVSTVLFLVCVWSLIVIAGLSGRQRTAFLAGSLLLAPFHTGISTCNLTIIAIEVGVLATCAKEKRRDVLSGLLIAISIALKPQIGLCFLAAHILHACWKAASIASVSVLAMAAGAISRLKIEKIHWVQNYAIDSKALLSAGILGDFTERNPTRFGLVNLQVALYPFLHRHDLTNLSAAVLCFALFAVLFFLLIKLRVKDHLLCLSAIVTLSLLPVYHRFYDAALLIIPLSWLIKNAANQSTNGRSRLSSMGGLLMIGVFILPGGSFLQVLTNEGRISSSLATREWWNGIVMAHSAWCLVILSIMLLYQIRAHQRRFSAAVSA